MPVPLLPFPVHLEPLFYECENSRLKTVAKIPKAAVPLRNLLSVEDIEQGCFRTRVLTDYENKGCFLFLYLAVLIRRDEWE